jgi:hypothetical protein
MSGGGGKSGGGSNANLDQIINSIVSSASSMTGSQRQMSEGTSGMQESITGLGSEKARLGAYNRALAEAKGAARTPLDMITSMGAAPSGQLYSGKMDPFAAARYGQAIQEDLAGARRSNAELARQLGARGGDEQSVLRTLQSENVNQARLNRSPLLTAMMEQSRAVEREQRAADVASYGANLQRAAQAGQAVSPLMAILGQTGQTMLAGRGREVAQQQQTGQTSDQRQDQTSRQETDTRTAQRERDRDDPFTVPGSATPQVNKPAPQQTFSSPSSGSNPLQPKK